MIPCSPPMMFASIVGHARRHTAGRSGPSMIDRSNLRRSTPPAGVPGIAVVGIAGDVAGGAPATSAAGVTDGSDTAQVYAIHRSRARTSNRTAARKGGPENRSRKSDRKCGPEYEVACQLYPSAAPVRSPGPTFWSAHLIRSPVRRSVLNGKGEGRPLGLVIHAVPGDWDHADEFDIPDARLTQWNARLA